METINEKKYAENIRRQYAPQSEQQGKLNRLKSLDAKVRRPAIVFAYVFGCVGTLILGTGMCLAMKVIGNMVAAGIAVGAVGIVAVCVNYFIYKVIIKHRKNKYSDQILKLSDELLNKNTED